jgi:hypothetical protein
MAVLHSHNLSYRQIVDLFGRDHKIVKDRIYPIENLLSIREDPEIPQEEKSRNRRFSGLVQHFILFALVEDPTRSVRQLSKMMLQMKLPFARHKTVISDIVKQMHINYTETIKRSNMTERHVANRLAFAQILPLDIRHTLPWFFTDECSIDMNPSRKSAYRIPGMWHNEKNFQEFTKHTIRIMVWGGIARNYKSPLILINGIINAEKYIQILNDHSVIETLDEIHGHKRWVFQDDGATPHRARIATTWLSERCLTLTRETVPWPAMSPDLNPQEQMWAILKEGINTEGCTSPEELYNCAVSAWDAIPIDVVNRLVDSFNVRLLAVEALQGECLNGHREIMRRLRREVTPEQIRNEMEKERLGIRKFVDDSRVFFGSFPSEWIEIHRYQRLMRVSYEVVHNLPWAILTRTNVLNCYPRWCPLWCPSSDEEEPGFEN